MELPKIIFKGRIFFFDYRLKQLREVSNNETIKFIDLSSNETELLQYAVKKADMNLIKSNMLDIQSKF